MSPKPSSTLPAGIPPDAAPRSDVRWRRRVDGSVRRPVIVFVVSGAFWLLLGSVFALLASFEFQYPDAAGAVAWLAFGRVRPAHLNAMIYGWISMAGVGITLWLWVRLLKTPLRGGVLTLLSAVLWNVGVTAGIVGILAGFSRSVEWLEMPLVAFAFIVPALLLVAVSMLWTLRHRQVRHLFISVWYLGASVLWAPLLLVAVLLPIYSGVPHAAANWWFAHNILGLWLTPVGLAAAYYLIPKVTGRPVYSYHLSYLGFWTLALFYNWAGVHHLVGGPAPQWLVTVSIVFSLMMIIPVTVVGLNHHMTMVGHFGKLRYSPTLRFVVFGAISYTVVSLQGAFQAVRMWQVVTHFTHYTVAHSHLGVYAFATMVAFGALYYIMPRVTDWEWAHPRLVSVHFWTTAIGITLYWAALTLGGVEQGLALLDPAMPFNDVVDATKSWLWLRSISGVLLTAGHLAFAYLLYGIVRRRGMPGTGPTYLQWAPAGLFSSSRRTPAAASA